MARTGADVVRGDWINIPAATYVSADSPTYVMTVPGDLTGKVQAGTRIRCTHSALVKYFIVSKAPSFGSGVTTLTMYGGSATPGPYTLSASAITSVGYSNLASPIGFPTQDSTWTFTFTDNTGRLQSTPTQNTVYNPGSISVDLPVGAWRVSWCYSIRCQLVTTKVNGSVHGYLSTDTSTTGGADSTGQSIHTSSRAAVVMGGQNGAANNEGRVPCARVFDITMSTKTTYFMNTHTNTATGELQSIGFDSTNTLNELFLTCNYL